MQVYDAVNRHFNFDELKVLIIASPGFTKETVYSFLLDEAVVRTRPQSPAGRRADGVADVLTPASLLKPTP